MFSNRFHLILSVIGFLVCVSAVGSFLYLKFYAASGWAAVAVIFSLANVQLNYLLFKKKISSWHSVETLTPIYNLSVFASVICCGALMWYIFYYFYYKDEDAIMTVVWSFISLKWTVSLYYTVRRSLAAVQDQFPSLLPSGSRN